MIAESISGRFTSLVSTRISFLVTSIFVSGCDPHTNFPTSSETKGASRFRDRLLALSALYASCGQVEQPGLVKEASSFDPCFQGPQHRIGPHCVFHPFPSCPQGFFVLFRLLCRSHCRQVLFTHLSSFPFHLPASLCSTVVTRFLATMDALTAALCGSSFPCAHDMNSAPYPRQLSRFQCSSL